MNILRMVLYPHLKSQLTSDKMTYIFLDELHHIHDFPHVVDSLCIKKISICMDGSRGSSEKEVLYTEYLQNNSFPYALAPKDDPICNSCLLRENMQHHRRQGYCEPQKNHGCHDAEERPTLCVFEHRQPAFLEKDCGYDGVGG